MKKIIQMIHRYFNKKTSNWFVFVTNSELLKNVFLKVFPKINCPLNCTISIGGKKNKLIQKLINNTFI